MIFVLVVKFPVLKCALVSSVLVASLTKSVDIDFSFDLIAFPECYQLQFSLWPSLGDNHFSFD